MAHSLTAVVWSIACLAVLGCARAELPGGRATDERGAAPPAARKPLADSAVAADSSKIGSASGGASTGTAPAILSEVTIEGRRFRLDGDGRSCVFRSLDDGLSPRSLPLDLTPPCYIMSWSRPPPRAVAGQGPSQGVPVGEAGGPALWRYPDLGMVAVLAVIGDPVSPPLAGDSVSTVRAAHGYHCAGSVQGVLFRKGTLARSPKRANVGELCVEVGMDEKGYWLLAHPRGASTKRPVGGAGSP